MLRMRPPLDFFLRCKPLVADMKPNPAGFVSQLVENLLDLAETSGKASDKWAPKDLPDLLIT